MKLRRFQYTIMDPTTNVIRAFIFISAFFAIVFGQEQIKPWRQGHEGHGTVHEQQGQQHFPAVQYEKYVSKAKFTEDREHSEMGLGPVFDFTHSLFYFLALRNTSYLLPDYVKRTNVTIFSLGQKYEKNDWMKLLEENKALVILWIFPLLVLITIMPFIAVIYCCFCCWRCKNPCSTCNQKSAYIKRIIYSLVLFLILLGLILAFTITMLSHKQMSRNVAHSSERMKRGSQDTCTFLKDVDAHIYHLLVKNFETLKDEVTEQANEAHKHIFFDLIDTADGNALTELERILLNMPESIKALKFIDQNEKDLRFYGSMYRDNMRGIKRDIIYMAMSICKIKDCLDFLEKTKIPSMDSSKCLHLDDMPNTTIYLEPMEDAVNKQLVQIAKKALLRLKMVGDTVKECIKPIIPPLLEKLSFSANQFYNEYVTISNIINKAMSDIHLRTLRAATSFDDLNHRFGTDRPIFTNISCLVLLLIIIALVFSLISGLFFRKNNIGSNCMIFVIIFILCVFSFITLVGLFYYVLGMVTYQATCKRLEELESIQSSEVRLSDTLSACREDETIFDFLKKYNLYDAKQITELDMGQIHEFSWCSFAPNKTDFTLITMQELDLLNNTLHDLYKYQGKSFTELLCKELSSPTAYIAGDKLLDFLRVEAFKPYKLKCGRKGSRHMATCTFGNTVYREIKQLKKLEYTIFKCIDAILQKVPKLDALLGCEGFVNFGEKMELLITTMHRTEKFLNDRGSDFIYSIGKNLSDSMREKVELYAEMTTQELQKNVGPCKPLAYIQDRGIKYACQQLIDPINGFWLGLLLSCLLFLPLLFVGQRLICLYRTDSDPKSPVVYLSRYDGCPTCSGAPYKPPPVVVCTGRQPEKCQCELPENKHDQYDVEEGVSKSKKD